MVRGEPRGIGEPQAAATLPHRANTEIVEVLKAIWGLLLASGAAFSWVSPGAVHPLGSGSVPSTLGSWCFQLASGALHVSGAQGAIPRSGLKPLLGNHAPAFDLVSTHV